MVCVPGRGTSSLWQVQETHTESCWTLTLHYVSKYKSLDVCDKMTSDNIEAYIVKKGECRLVYKHQIKPIKAT